MYLKLGKINSTTTSNSQYDFFIVSSVIDSQLSYEYPILINTSEDLDIYFGKDFTYRSYFDFLLDSGVALYLYKPISPTNKKGDDYIDYSNYNTTTYKNIYYSIDEIPDSDKKPNYIYELLNGEKYIYINNNFENIDLLPQNISGISSSLDNRDTLFITKPGYEEVNSCFTEYDSNSGKIGLFTSDINYGSINYDNSLNSLADNNTISFSLRYTGSDTNRNLGDDGYIVITNLDLSTSSYFVTKNGLSESSDYYVNHKTIGFLSHNVSTGDIDEKLNTSEYGIANYAFNDYTNISDTTYQYRSLITTFDDLVGMYSKLGYTTKKISDTEYIIFSNNCYITNVTNFYTFKTIEIEKNNRINNNIVYNHIKENGCIAFWSKTIGYDVNKIKIIIDKLDNDLYRITLNRFNYTEIFEGYLYPNENEERLDFKINKNSKLVSCSLVYGTNYTPKLLSSQYNILSNTSSEITSNDFYIKFKSSLGLTNTDTIKIKTKRLTPKLYNLEFEIKNNTYTLDYELCSDTSEINNEFIEKINFLGFGLKTGEYYLDGSEIETYDTTYYKKGLDYMFDSNKESVYPDFFLVLDKEKYSNNFDYKNIFYPIAENYKLQVLIENNIPYSYTEINTGESFPTDPDSKTVYKYNNNYYLGSSLLDLTVETNKVIVDIAVNSGDFIYNYCEKNNRLVYFYDSIYVNYYKKPGYFLFLLSVFNNVFSISSTNILYDSPVKKDPYEIDENTLTDKLKKYKSNYLVYNNHKYYYDDLQDGSIYTSSIWMRFILGKIEREIYKNKGYIIGNKNSLDVKNIIEYILTTIKNKFALISYIELTEFLPDYINNSLKLTIKTGVNQLTKNNITLDLTINFNNL